MSKLFDLNPHILRFKFLNFSNNLEWRHIIYQSCSALQDLKQDYKIFNTRLQNIYTKRGKPTCTSDHWLEADDMHVSENKKLHITKYIL